MKSVKFAIGTALALVMSLVSLGVGVAGAQEITDCFYLKSLHYTAAGMEYWYKAEQGGLEKITGIPYDKLSCKGCHNGGCDVCHKAEKVQKECKQLSYT